MTQLFKSLICDILDKILFNGFYFYGKKNAKKLSDEDFKRLEKKERKIQDILERNNITYETFKKCPSYYRNKQRHSDKRKEYYKQNSDKIKKYMKKYYKNNKERLNNNMKEYYKKNKKD